MINLISSMDKSRDKDILELFSKVLKNTLKVFIL